MHASRIERILVIHPEPETRRSVAAALRQDGSRALSLYEAGSMPEGLESIRRLEPDVVLLDLTDEQGLALEVAREARRPDRRLVGLYNPLVVRDHEVDFLRRFARAGVGDFIPLPASAAELQAALDAAPVGLAAKSAAEGRMVAFMSPKGGVGTTVTAVNAALALGGSGSFPNGVALCDAALQFGSVATMLGLVPDRDLADMVRDLDDLGPPSAYLVRLPDPGVSVLARPRDPRDAERVSPEGLSRALINLRRSFDLVVVDTPPNLDLLTLAALDLSERIFVVTEGIAPALLATSRFLDLLAEMGFAPERIGVVLNRAGLDGTLSEAQVGEQLGRRVDYSLPYDKAVVTSVHTGTPLVVGRRKTPFAKAVADFAQDAALYLAPRS